MTKTAETRKFELKALMERAAAPTAAVFAERCGTNRKWVHNRMSRGINWIEADELAVRCGFLPWEIWPEWESIDPTVWLPPLCEVHGNAFAQDLPDLTQTCGGCTSDRQVAAAA